MVRPTPLRAVVVGTSFGCRVHVPALRAAGFEIVALVGRDPERTARRAERAGVERACGSLGEAIGLGADVVSVASPPATHAPLARQAIAAGCHVLVEKPFTLDTGEARLLLEEAEAAGLVHLIGHEFRWSTGRSVPARALAAGIVGEPRVATFVSWVPFVPDPDTRMQAWWWDPAQGGGWLGASGSHIIDQIRTWLGEVESVSAGLSVVSDRPASGAEDSFTARLRMRSGCEVTFQQTAAAWGAVGSISAVAGPLGTLWVNGDDVTVADRTGTRPARGARRSAPPGPTRCRSGRSALRLPAPRAASCHPAGRALSGPDPGGGGSRRPPRRHVLRRCGGHGGPRRHPALGAGRRGARGRARSRPLGPDEGRTAGSGRDGAGADTGSRVRPQHTRTRGWAGWIFRRSSGSMIRWRW